MIKQLTYQEIKSDYGNFKYWEHPTLSGHIIPDIYWVASHIRYQKIRPFGWIYCHDLVVNHLWKIGLDLMTANCDIDMSHGAGCFVPKHINFKTDKPLSRHSWGIAIDFNIKDNPIGQIPKMDKKIISIFEEYHWFWGGNFKTPDGMHFEKGYLE